MQIIINPRNLRSIFFWVILLTQTVPVYSQYSLSAGPLTGVNVNFYNGSGLVSKSTGFGFVFGGVVDLMVTSRFGFLGRILYDNKSGSFTSQDTNSQGSLQNIENNINLSYFTVDGLLKYRLPGTGLSFYAGPSLGIPIHGTSEHTVATTTNNLDTGITTTTTTTTVKEDIKNLSTRFEIKLGLGFDFPISKKFCLTTQTSLGWGFSSVKENFSWKITSWQTTVGVKFDLAGKGFR